MRYLLFILLISCSTFTDESHFEVDPLLKTQVDNFYTLAYQNKSSVQHQNLLVHFSETVKNYGVLGITFHNEIAEVQLDNSLKNADPLFVEYVLYHELGHALYFREHCFDCYSLMNPNKYVQDFRMDSTKRMVLIKELFK